MILVSFCRPFQEQQNDTTIIEVLMQLVCQLINAWLTGQWSSAYFFSLSGTAFDLFCALYRYGYHFFILQKGFDEIEDAGEDEIRIVQERAIELQKSIDQNAQPQKGSQSAWKKMLKKMQALDIQKAIKDFVQWLVRAPSCPGISCLMLLALGFNL